jgi:glycerol kinase
MSGEAFVLAIDQGTTSTRAIVFDREGRPRASAQLPLTQVYPAPGHVEHDPEEIWRSVLHVGRAALGDIEPKRIAGLGITISARRRSSGSGRARGRSPMPSCGRTAAPPRSARRLRARGGAIMSRKRPVS